MSRDYRDSAEAAAFIATGDSRETSREIMCALDEGDCVMSNEKYNGWTNYATWRVNLEMFDAYDGASDNDLDAYDLGQSLREMALETVAAQASGLALDYAEAFLADVNWYEIAEHMIEDYREVEADA